MQAHDSGQGSLWGGAVAIVISIAALAAAATAWTFAHASPDAAPAVAGVEVPPAAPTAATPASAIPAAGAAPGTSPVAVGVAPAHLADTGLYSDFDSKTIRAGNLAYEPQYPLWSDGARKRRWICLPPGSAIDASDPGHWRFPVGTKLWKEFSFGRRVETRYMELGADGNWILATYVWNGDETDATLAPESGVKGVCEIRPGVMHDIPGRYDCMACHEGQPNRVLGFSALQLSPDRDPLAPHAQTPEPGAVDLAALIRRGLLRGYPASWTKHPPRIDAATPRARAAIGYLHGNCSGCHNEEGPLASLGFSMEVAVSRSGATEPRILATAVGRTSHFHPAEFPAGPCVRFAPGSPEQSVAVARISTRNPYVQMPPLGTHVVDDEAVQLITDWIRLDLKPQAASTASNARP